MKMTLDGLLWPDIPTCAFSEKALQIYKLAFGDIGPLPKRPDDQEGLAIDAKHEDTYKFWLNILPFSDSNGLVAVDEKGQVVVRQVALARNCFRLDKRWTACSWKQDTEARQNRWLLMHKLGQLEKFMLSCLEKETAALGKTDAKAPFLFSDFNGEEIAASLDEVRSLYYLLETSGYISWRGAARRDAATLYAIKGEEESFLEAETSRLVREEWAESIRELMKASNHVTAIMKDNEKGAEGLCREAFEKIWPIASAKGYDEKSIKDEIRLEVSLVYSLPYSHRQMVVNASTRV